MKQKTILYSMVVYQGSQGYGPHTQTQKLEVESWLDFHFGLVSKPIDAVEIWTIKFSWPQLEKTIAVQPLVVFMEPN